MSNTEEQKNAEFEGQLGLAAMQWTKARMELRSMDR